MAFLQPRVPEYREREGADRYIRSLVLFLKDFCMDVWTANNQRTGEIDAVREGYPVTCVCGKTGDVALTAGDVGARPEDWTPTASDVGALAVGGKAVNAGKLDGKTWAQALDAIYPVGAVYLSAEPDSPASLFGGTWERIMDRFLLGAGDAYAAGSTGGEETVALATEQMPSHTHTPTDNTPGTSIYNQYGMQVLRHLSSASTLRAQVAKGSDYYVNAANPKASDYGSLDDVSVMYKTGATGGGAAHNNMPPYLAVYMWKRVS